MKKLLFGIAATLFMAVNSAAAEQTTALPQAILHTSKGDIKIELYQQRSPLTVANFLKYASSGFYDNTIFHRVIRRFVVQGGGLTDDLEEKKNGEPIANESKLSGLRNERWTLAMARTADPN
ncbi:MAG: peptidylprolyl isomerase, partial [Spongiibacteraceae bacterium]